jgi:hypothetical protein
MFSSSNRYSKMECAYCHIVGHHIRECAELAAKNKRRPVPTQQLVQEPVLLPKQVPATTLSKTLRNGPRNEPRNAFSALYSSDEEEEEGEIVEERRPVPSAVVFEEEQEEPSSWSRGGFRGIQIAQQQASEASECFDCYDEQSVIDGLKSLQAFVNQFKGMSWVDI